MATEVIMKKPEPKTRHYTEEELEVIRQVERGLEDLRHGRYTEVKKK